MISIIVAIARNGVIGNKGQLPWHLPEDLKHFKATTMDHPILMGRKTFESIGKVLPGRENIVLTQDKNFKAPGLTVIHNFSEILTRSASEELFVIGGSKIYTLALPHAQKLYLTQIDQDFEGDTYFPEINLGRDYSIVKEGPWQISPKENLKFRFVMVKRFE